MVHNANRFMTFKKSEWRHAESESSRLHLRTQEEITKIRVCATGQTGSIMNTDHYIDLQDRFPVCSASSLFHCPGCPLHALPAVCLESLRKVKSTRASLTLSLSCLLHRHSENDR